VVCGAWEERELADWFVDVECFEKERGYKAVEVMGDKGEVF
jgi:hypothetical protein